MPLLEFDLYELIELSDELIDGQSVGWGKCARDGPNACIKPIPKAVRND